LQTLKCTTLYSSHRLATKFQVFGLVVQKQVNGFRKVLILSTVISCWFESNRRSSDQRQ